MISLIRSIFSPPVFEDDEEKNHQAYLLHFVIWGLIFLPIPYVIFAFIRAENSPVRPLVQSITGEVINFFILYLLRKGYVRPAAIVQIVTFWIFFTVSAFTGAGVKGEAYLLGYPLVITIAGILLGTKAGLIVTVASLFSGGIMFWGESNGTLLADNVSTPLVTWAVTIAFFPISVLLQNLSARTVRIALARARASEDRYKNISRVSTNYTFETRVDEQGNGHLVWVGGGFTEMTGYTYEEYVASGGWDQHVHPDDQERDAQDMETLRNNQDVQSEIRTFQKNGDIRWEKIYAHPIWDHEKNRLTRIVGAVRDVTEEKKAQNKLNETLLQQDAILNNIPEMAWLKDREGRYVAINEAFARNAGMNRDEIIGKTDIELWPPHLAEKYRLDDQKVINTLQVISVEEPQVDAHGNEFWVKTTKLAIYNTNGEVIGITGIARDISQHKQAELFEKRRRAMLEKVIDLGKYVTEPGDLRATIVKIWSGVHHDLGFDRLAIFLYNAERNSMDDTVGTDNQGNMVDNWHLWFPVGEGSTFSHVLAKPENFFFTSNYDVENNIPEGHEMYGVKDFVAVAAWVGNKPVAVICADNFIHKNPITIEQLEAIRLFGGYAGLAIENARLHEALQGELNQRKNFITELEAKNAELERFTYTVSHDLKSPLVTITGFLGYLEKDALAGNFQKFKQDVERIGTAVNKMQRLLKDLLELSRIGRLMNSPVDIKFEDIVHDALDLLQGQIEEKNVFVEFENNHVIVKGDQVRLVEVMQNLLDNAIKFSENLPTPRIKVGSFKNDSGETVFFVKDKGVGIAPEYHDKIFGLFNKLNPEGNGTGIGLTLVKRIIEVHGGRIWVESEPQHGATFYFTLPVS